MDLETHGADKKTTPGQKLALAIIAIPVAIMSAVGMTAVCYKVCKILIGWAM